MMLYRKTKSGLQSDLYTGCLSLHMTTTQLKDYEHETYEETIKVIKENGWDALPDDIDTVNFCNKYLVNDWLEGKPDGGDVHQCIVILPMSDFKYDDIDCDNFDHENLGFVCMYKPPNVSG